MIEKEFDFANLFLVKKRLFMTIFSSLNVLNGVFDELIWCTIGPKSFLFDTAQFSLWASGTVNYDYIVTNSINTLLISLRCIEPIWLMFQILSKTLVLNNGNHATPIN